MSMLPLSVHTVHRDLPSFPPRRSSDLVRNVGTLPAPGPMTLTDTLPAGLTYVSGTGSGWSCSAAEQTVTCGKDRKSTRLNSSHTQTSYAVLCLQKKKHSLPPRPCACTR